MPRFNPTPILSSTLTSPTRRSAIRRLHAAARRLRGGQRRVDYFHRVSDPYCQLMVQVLPELARRFDLTIQPHVVEQLDPVMYPAREMLDAYAVDDAAALADLYGLAFANNARRPDDTVHRSAARALAARADDDDFFDIARTVGEAYWRGEPAAEPAAATDADARLRADEAILARRGHYFTATVAFEGEWYWSLDRLGHLEDRLLRIDAGDADARRQFDRTWRGVMDPPAQPVAHDHALELFFSVRSPYSYIGYEQARRFARATGVDLVLRPVLPMMMRGMHVPWAKKLYILTDTKREAERAGLPFGKVADPLGVGVERSYAVAHWAEQQAGGRQDTLAAFFDALLGGVMAEGIDVSTDAGLRRIVERAGLDWSGARAALAAEGWRDWVEGHRAAMFDHGLWGVPCMRYGDTAVWGQDRFWRVRQAMGID